MTKLVDPVQPRSRVGALLQIFFIQAAIWSEPALAAQRVDICNKSSEQRTTALIRNLSASGWTADGLRTLKPGECFTVTQPLVPQSAFYVYTDRMVNWRPSTEKGSIRACIDMEANFSYPYTDGPCPPGKRPFPVRFSQLQIGQSHTVLLFYDPPLPPGTSGDPIPSASTSTPAPAPSPPTTPASAEQAASSYIQPWDSGECNNTALARWKGFRNAHSSNRIEVFYEVSVRSGSETSRYSGAKTLKPGESVKIVCSYSVGDTFSNARDTSRSVRQTGAAFR
jgi:hypothetical protein